MYFTIFPTTDVFSLFIFFCAKPFFKLYSVACVVALSNTRDIYPSGIFCKYKCLLVHIRVFNQRLCQFFSKVHKTIIRIEETSHLQICIHFSTGHEITKNRMGHQIVPNALYKKVWVLVLQYVSSHCYCTLTPCICTDPQHLQDTWTWLPTHSTYFSLPSEPL